MMRTDTLIRALAADPSRSRNARTGVRTGTRLALAMAAAACVSLAVLMLGVGIRADLWDAIVQGPVAYKLSFALALGLGAFLYARLCARPDGHPRAVSLAPALLLLAAGALFSLQRASGDAMAVAGWGAMQAGCLGLVTLFSLPPLAAGLLVMRGGAPRDGARAGAAIGLLAAGLGAGVYALYCPVDDPIFVAVWYGLAAAIVAAGGAAIGRRALAW